MFIDAGSEDRNITPTLELAMPVAGTAGQLAALGVPLGTRPNMVASYVWPPRVIVTTLSFGQLFARNTAKHGGAMLGRNDGVATVKSQPTEPWLAAAAAHAATHTPAAHP